MEWVEAFISQTLEAVPECRYRARAEAELRDHLETQYRALTENGWGADDARKEALRAMGEPEKLREEYKTAWRRSLPGRLRQLSDGADAWLDSIIVMGGTHLIVWFTFVFTFGAFSPLLEVHLYFNYFVSTCISLTVGAFYLRRKFKALPTAVWQVSVPLIVFWTLRALMGTWLYHLYRPRTIRYNIRYYLLTLAICIMIGQLFGRLPMGKREKKAAAS